MARATPPLIKYLECIASVDASPWLDVTPLCGTRYPAAACRAERVFTRSSACCYRSKMPANTNCGSKHLPSESVQSAKHGARCPRPAPLLAQGGLVHRRFNTHVERVDVNAWHARTGGCERVACANRTIIKALGFTKDSTYGKCLLHFKVRDTSEAHAVVAMPVMSATALPRCARYCLHVLMCSCWFDVRVEKMWPRACVLACVLQPEPTTRARGGWRPPSVRGRLSERAWGGAHCAQASGRKVNRDVAADQRSESACTRWHDPESRARLWCTAHTSLGLP